MLEKLCTWLSAILSNIINIIFIKLKNSNSTLHLSFQYLLNQKQSVLI